MEHPSTGNRCPATDNKLIPLAVITSAHGVRGEVKLKSFAANPENITSYGPLCDSKGRIYNVTVLSANKDMLIVRIEGVNDRNDAEKLRGIELCVPRAALPQTEENEYYIEDLTGLSLSTEDGKPYGTLKAMHNFGGGDIAEVMRADGEAELIPFTRQTFPTILLAERRAVINPPEPLEES